MPVTMSLLALNASSPDSIQAAWPYVARIAATEVKISAKEMRQG